MERLRRLRAVVSHHAVEHDEQRLRTGLHPANAVYGNEHRNAHWNANLFMPQRAADYHIGPLPVSILGTADARRATLANAHRQLPRLHRFLHLELMDGI